MLKNILVYVDTSETAKTRVETSILMAKHFQAQLTGLYADDWAQRIMMMAPEVVPAVTESQRQLWLKRQTEAQQIFSQLTQAANFKAEWLSVEGEISDAICDRAQAADLVVLSQHNKHDPKLPDFDIAHGVLLGSSSPTLILPTQYDPAVPGQNIMIAWDGSKEAARAIKDTLPLLKQAKTTELITVTSDSLLHGGAHIDQTRMRDYLLNHGIEVNAQHIEGHKINAGEALLLHAENNNIDLIVMGAYGHSRLREVVLGGTTRHFLKNCRIPMLMSH